MSRENVETVRAAADAWVRGDFDAMFETWHEDVVWDTTHFDGWPENPIYRDKHEVRRFLREWLQTWDRYEASYEVTEAGERVVLFWLQRMVGRSSAVPVELESTQILTFRDEKVSRVDNYTDREEALEAAGLSSTRSPRSRSRSG